MIVLLLLLIPLLGGLLTFFLKNDAIVRSWTLVISFIALLLAMAGNFNWVPADQLEFNGNWMGSLGSSFALKMDGLGKVLCMLTTLTYPIILLSTWKTTYKKPNNFFALLLLTQAGLIGVFIS